MNLDSLHLSRGEVWPYPSPDRRLEPRSVTIRVIDEV